MEKRTHKNEVTFEEKFNDYGEYENSSNEEMDYSITSIETAPNYEDNSRNSYEDENDPDNGEFIKRLLIALMLFAVIVIIILLLLKACAKGNMNNNEPDLEGALLKAGKDYYSELVDELPSVKGTCTTVTLNVLRSLEYLGNEYDECDGENTYVKVCLLNNGDYHYLPIMSCHSIKTDFGDYKKGTEEDLTKDKSDVMFTYKATYLDEAETVYGKTEEYWEGEVPYKNYKTVGSTTYYRYRDKEYTWTLRKRYYYPGDKTNASEIGTYYAKYPANNYVNSTGKTTAYRYYTLTDKTYYPNGAYGYELTAPNGYPYYDESESIAYVYYKQKTWTEQSKPILNSPTKMYVCKNPDKPTFEFFSYDECSTNANEKYNEGFTVTDRIIYTCDAGITTVSSSSKCKICSSGGLKSDGTSCGYYSDWSTPSSTKCDTSKKDICQSVTYIMKRWYKAEKEYYGNTSPTGQVPYYKEAPVAGAIKDESTATTVYKWYKLVDGGVTTEYSASAPAQDALKTDSYRWGEWTKYSTTKPKTISGTRQIEKKAKLKVKRIISSSESSWKDVSNTYLTEQELVKELQKLGYKVNTLEDVMLIGDVKITIQLNYRDRI